MVIFPSSALHVEFSVKTSTTKNVPGFIKTVEKLSLHNEASVTSTKKTPPGNPENETVSEYVTKVVPFEAEK